MGRMQKKIEGIFVDSHTICEYTDYANELYSKRCIGVIEEKHSLQLNLYEALFLFESKNLIIKNKRNQEMSYQQYIKKALKQDKDFIVNYSVFKDLRKKGYIVKTALKFGGAFRVYNKGIKPGEEHALWIVYPVFEHNYLTWQEFSAKNRVAHSTKKKLLVGIVDDEKQVTYYENNWIKP